MTRSHLGTATAGLVLLVLGGGSLVRPGPVPRLGPFLDPVRGAWSVARGAELPANHSARVSGLSAPVTVLYDHRGVPHLFGANELDLVRALGYVAARDRLLQLELQWRAGAGRLTELLGPGLLAADRRIRALGMADAAERRFLSLPADSRDRLLLDAYADGVNARIAELGPRDIPLEYHLVGRTPTPWHPVHGLYLLGRMGWTLALSDLEDQQERARAIVGPAAADALYPVHSPIQEPIVPNGQTVARYDAFQLPPPGEHGMDPPAPAPAPAESTGMAAESTLSGFLRDSRSFPDAVGSNNWAVAPHRTAAGYALLAGDQHLDLSLPSLWYEAHLVIPDSLDVYGVTIPGAAGIIIGFNRDVAWTFTNAEADVRDRYAEVVDDTARPASYRLDGSWRPIRLEEQRYLDPAGSLLLVDTVRFTHRGPLTRSREGGWMSTRWTVLEAGGELTQFSGAARAATALAWLDSMAAYHAPAQNMLVADRGGVIAIRSTGRFPLRPVVRGDLVQRGDTTASDWPGDWPLADLPQAVNPLQGYLASANQEPIDPRVNPRYLGADWYSPWRAIRINELLRKDSAVTPDAMRRYQTDPGSPAADVFVPAFFSAARRFPERDSLQRAAALLAQWDRRYTRDNSRAVLYEAAIRETQRLLWDELRGPPGTERPPHDPGLAIVAVLLREPGSVWWDRRSTRAVEDRDEILARALVTAMVETERRYGPPEGDGWRWDRIRHANIWHLLHLRGLSALEVPVQGGQSTLNPSSGPGAFGPTWRMVVELGPEIRAWGIYPGGQSGNPASSRYADRVRTWSEGQLDTLFVPRTLEAAAGRQTSGLRLEPVP